MSLLLDTHTFLWMDSEPEKLSTSAAALILDPLNLLLLSAASLWEIQIKSTLGKLRLRVPLRQIVGENEQQNGLVVLPIFAIHVHTLDQLPRIHNDPFGRLIVAVARVEDATLLSADSVLRDYPIRVIW